MIIVIDYARSKALLNLLVTALIYYGHIMVLSQAASGIITSDLLIKGSIKVLSTTPIINWQLDF